MAFPLTPDGNFIIVPTAAGFSLMPNQPYVP
jgi:hypothetical protein